MKEMKDMKDRLGRYFPDEFPKRLERLKDLAGVSWEELADVLGVSRRRMMRWRRGGKPSGGGFWAVLSLAAQVPGGMDAMLPRPSETSIPEE